MRFSPSLACADQLNLAHEVNQLLDLGIDMLHFDIMDGHYVPNLCLSMDTGRQISTNYPMAELDVHLMVTDPVPYIEKVKVMGAHRVAIHLDSTPFLRRALGMIRGNGMKAGVVLNPSEPVTLLSEVIEYLDFVLVMSIEPGFAGQTFMPDILRKVEHLARMRDKAVLGYEISVDGGITPQIGLELMNRGADILVLGYPFLFSQPDGIAGAWRRGLRIMGIGT